MATWKKIIVSGSAAELSTLNTDTLVQVSTNQVITNLPSTTYLSGSFSGSFQGDGSALTGIASTLTFSDESDTSSTVALKTQTFKITGGTGIDTSASGQTLTISGEDATTTTKGIASFSDTNFDVTSGAVSTKDFTLTAGTGLTSTDESITLGGSATLSVDYGSTAGTAVEGNTQITITGAANEIDIVESNAQALGGGPSYTIGLPNNVTIGNNLTVTGNLTVNGDTTVVDTTNLTVEDRYILLNSGNATATNDSGIVFGGVNGTANSGAALVWDADYNSNDGRLGVANTLAADASANATVNYYVAGVFEGDEAAAATAEADHVGNIRVDSSDNIWIYV